MASFSKKITLTTSYQTLDTLLGTDTITAGAGFFRNLDPSITVYVAIGYGSSPSTEPPLAPLDVLKFDASLVEATTWLKSASGTPSVLVVSGSTGYEAPTLTGVSTVSGSANEILRVNSSGNLVASAISDDGAAVTIDEEVLMNYALTVEDDIISSNGAITAQTSLNSGSHLQVGTYITRATVTPITSSASMTLNAELGDIFTLTPAHTGDINFTGLRVGQMLTLHVTTSGVTPYTLTFNTNAVSTGTLATGSVTAKNFIVQFYSNGTTAYEISRTAAM